MQLPRWTRRRQRAIFFTLLLSFVSAFWVVTRHDLSRDHYLSSELVGYSSNFEAGYKALLSPEEARSVCRAHGFHPYGKKGRRKIYDLVLLSTELDWLEIRLNTLAPYVDYFVVVESPTTFTSKPKPLYLKDNWQLFENFHHKLIHRVVSDPIKSQRIWDHEDYFRNSLLSEVFPGLVGTEQEAYPGDVLVVSDMDEIVRPGAMLLLRYCDIPARLTLRTDFYYYSFQWRHRGPQWAHPDATLYKGSKTLPPNHLRQGLLDDGWLPLAAWRRWWDRGTLWDAGWHCSSCFATVAEMRTKMHSFSHQGWNTANNRDSITMMERVRNGIDLFGREGELYDKVESNQDVPPYILAQFKEKGRFKYLLNRDGEDAGFEDWESVIRHDS